MPLNSSWRTESSEDPELLQGSHQTLGISAAKHPAPSLAQGSYLVKVCKLARMIYGFEQRLEHDNPWNFCPRANVF